MTLVSVPRAHIHTHARTSVGNTAPAVATSRQRERELHAALDATLPPPSVQNEIYIKIMYGASI